MLCAYCGENQRSAGDYVRHCREVHDGKFEDFDETFASMAEFETFRERLRLEKNTEFVAMSGRNKNLDGSEYWRLVCVRSGKPDGRLKPKWTRKCGHWCTAHLRMKQFADGRVQAIGCLDHTGHDVSYDGMYLSSSALEEGDGRATVSPSPSIQEPPSVAAAEPALDDSVPSDSKAVSSSEMPATRRRHSCTAQIACAFCGLVLKTYSDYVAHCVDSHSMQLEQIDRTFDSLTEFEAFRKELRVERKTELISTSGKKRKGGTFMWSLVCARSGKPQQGSKRTRKCGFSCTAHLRVKQYPDGKVHTIGCLDHVAHDVGYDGKYSEGVPIDDRASPAGSAILEPPSLVASESLIPDCVPSTPPIEPVFDTPTSTAPLLRERLCATLNEFASFLDIVTDSQLDDYDDVLHRFLNAWSDVKSSLEGATQPQNPLVAVAPDGVPKTEFLAALQAALMQFATQPGASKFSRR